MFDTLKEISWFEGYYIGTEGLNEGGMVIANPTFDLDINCYS